MEAIEACRTLTAESTVRRARERDEDAQNRVFWRGEDVHVVLDSSEGRVRS